MMMSHQEPWFGSARVLRTDLFASILLPLSGVVFGQSAGGGDEVVAELQVRWQYFRPIEIRGTVGTGLVDVILPPGVFTHARFDLGDLRVYDAANHPVPYALRERRPDYRRVSFPAEEFNRTEGAGNSIEVTLEIKQEGLVHNEVEVKTPGTDFRRRVELEGSDDNKTWGTLTTTNLIRFHRGAGRINGSTITYPPSRFRYLRVRVFPDPSVDEGRVSIESVEVIHKVEIPGELLTLEAKLGDRQPIRTGGGPGSAWVIDLGGDKVPCERIEVVVDDAEFVRDIHIEVGGPAGSRQRFRRVGLILGNVWRRREGEPRKPMIATFAEIRASRLKLVVTDHQNEPLRIRSVKFSSAARQVVLAGSVEADVGWRLFFGNPDATAPNYDFARNLPDRLDPAPARATLAAEVTNPSFVPPPKPLTERWPWLIYIVLGCVSLVLGVIILSLARSAIAVHDREGDAETATA